MTENSTIHFHSEHKRINYTEEAKTRCTDLHKRLIELETNRFSSFSSRPARR